MGPSNKLIISFWGNLIVNLIQHPQQRVPPLPKTYGIREARRAIYATAAVPIFNHVYFDLPREVPVSNCFNGLLRSLTKNSLEDRMSKFHLVKKWWDFENRDFGV